MQFLGTPNLTFGHHADHTVSVLTPHTTTITITGVNDAPVVAAITDTKTEDELSFVTDLTAGQTDPDGDTLSVTGTPSISATDGIGDFTLPDGTVSIDGNNLTVDPTLLNALDDGESVDILVTYDVSDGTTTTQNTAIITVTGVNDAPSADGNTISIAEDGLHNFTAAEFNFDDDDKKNIQTTKGLFKTDFAVFAAGLQADELAKSDKISLDMQIIGFRGDYYNVVNDGLKKVKGLIYPVPNIDLPFLGVHLTKMHDGSIEAGPNAVFSFKKEGYTRTSFSLGDTFKAISFIGLWKLFSGYWKIGLMEYRRAFSKKLFLESLQSLVPNLKMEDIVKGKSGVRAQALDNKGNLIDDFLIKKTKNSLHIINAPSPAATASLAIADEVVSRIIIEE